MCQHASKKDTIIAGERLLTLWVKKIIVNMRKKLDIPEEELRRMYWDEEMSQAQMADALGCSWNSIQRRMAEYGIPNRRSPIPISQDVLQNLYLDQKKSAIEIAVMYRCGTSSIHRLMVKYNISARSSTESQRRLNISEAEIKELYLNKKLSSDRIGNKLGCDGETVRKYLKKYGIPRRPAAKIRTVDIPKDVLQDMYWNQGMDSIEIGNRFNCSPSVVRKCMDRSDIKCRHAGFRSGENHLYWRGGVSFEPYCHKFNERFKESIREKFNRTCFLCPTTESAQMEEMHSQGKRSFRLSIHHVSYDKDCLCDDSECEFVPLCLPCHTKTNRNREYWEEIIMGKLEAMKCESVL